MYDSGVVMGKLKKILLVQVLTLVASLFASTQLNIKSESRVSSDLKLDHTKYSYVDLSEFSESGQRLDSEMDETWSELTGVTEGLSLHQVNRRQVYQLKAVAGEYLNLAENPLRVQITHSWDQSIDKTSTYFNRQIDGLEEGLVNNNITIPSFIDISKEDNNLSMGKFIRFESFLQPDPYSRTHTRRSPTGTAIIKTELSENEFSPILEILGEKTGFEKGQYNREIYHDGHAYNVQLIVRQPTKDKMTFDLQVQEVGSLLLKRYALLYHKQNLTKLVSK